MKGRILLVAAVAVLLARPVHADEWTAAERAWVRTCVTGLTAPSLRQRESAAAALTQLGPAAVPAIAAASSALKTDDQWGVLEAVLAAMGPAEAVKALEASVKEWPEGTAGRRQALLDHLKAEAGKTPPPVVVDGGKRPPRSPEAVAAKVREILGSFDGERSYSAADRRIQELRRLGRPAIPALLEDLRTSPKEPSFRSDAAATALESLVVVGDVPVLTRLLADGHLKVAPALARLPAEAAVPALIAPLSAGLNSFELVKGLEPFKDDPHVPAALIAWLDKDPDGSESSLIGSVAELLEKTRVRAAVPTLLRALERHLESSHTLIATALVGLGEKRGIEALLEIFRAPADRWENFGRHAVGQRLNEVAGRRIYRGRSEWGDVVDGKFEEAIREFDAWWAEVKVTIRFDPDRRIWTTK